MRRFIVLFVVLFSITLNASVFDFLSIDSAKKEYKSGKYKEAIKEFEKLKTKDQSAIYDLANSYYKDKNYKKAAELYKRVDKKSLQFMKYHNLGNALAKLHKIDDAIKSYEEALKIKDDKDTRYNLELLKKMKKKQEKKKQNKKQNNKNKKNNKNQKKNDKNKDKDKKNKNSNKNKNKNQEKNRGKEKNKDKNKDDKKKKEQNRDKKRDKKSKDQKRENKEKKKGSKDKKQKQKMAKKASIKKEPISDKEVKKYMKLLNQRGINTLLIPMKSKAKEDRDEVKNW